MSIAQLRASLALWRSRYAYRLAREKFWSALHNRAGVDKWQKLRMEAKTMIHRRLKELGKEHPPQPHNIVMYDSVDVNTIPSSPEAVAGYVGGKWPTYNQLLKRFPHAHHLSIAVNASEDAVCLDVETGDADPSQAPAWVRKQHARGVKRPVLYASLSVMPAVKEALLHDSIKRSEYRLWSAHYTYQRHIEPGMDACQWTDKALNRNLDCSECVPSFFD